MRIALFGATGRVGAQFLGQALAAGHELTVLVRDPAKIPPRSGIRLVQGDATDAAAVARAIDGADAVVSALGPTKSGPPDINTQWTRNAIAAMQARGIRRIVVVSGAGAGSPPTEDTLLDKGFRAMINAFVKAPYQDKAAQLEILRASGLDWVAVRPPVMVEGARTGQYRMGDVKIGRRFRVCTGDVADALLRHVTPAAPSKVAPFLAGV